jgi:uncharacterized repeat protein (TIGR03803 family)
MKTLKAIAFGTAIAIGCPLAAQATSLSAIYSFGGQPNDGSSPYGGLVQKGMSNILFGTTVNGGQNDLGTVFQINKNGTGEAVIHNFANDTSGQHPFASLNWIGGRLSGTTQSGGFVGGTVFRMSPAGAFDSGFDYTFNCCGDGQNSSADLVYVGGSYYGTTQGGGAGWGTVFKRDPAGTVTIIHNFAGGAGGQLPYAGLVYLNGWLYGTTFNGGNAGSYGTIFRLKTNGTNFHVIYSFLGAGSGDGAQPAADLVSFAGGLWGTTRNGGVPSDLGTVYKITIPTTNSGTSTETPVCVFPVQDVSNPNAGAHPIAAVLPVFVTAGAPGKLYGTTSYGGSIGSGTVYSCTLTGTLTSEKSFTGPEGAVPQSAMINIPTSTGAPILYGTAAYGGSSGNGTVFKFVP